VPFARPLIVSLVMPGFVELRSITGEKLEEALTCQL